MEKYQRSDIVGVERENERDETYRSKLNPQIDRERTRFNHHFIKPNGSYTAFINRRLKELAPKRKVKDDAVLMASFLIGASPEFFKNKSHNDIDAFFFECTDFFAERYGRENIVSAVVHMDETTPHLHLNLMPILEGRPCAKKLFDRKALATLQSDLHKEIGSHWDLQRGKIGSKAQHLDTAAYKLKKMQESAIKAEQQADAAEARKALAEQDAAIAEQRQAHAEERTEDLAKEQARLEREVAPLQAAAETLQAYSDGRRKPNKKDVPTLAAELAKTKTALQYSTKDQSGLFRELQQAERKNAELQRSADLLKEIKEHAPEKLDEALEKVAFRPVTIISKDFIQNLRDALCDESTRVQTMADCDSDPVSVINGWMPAHAPEEHRFAPQEELEMAEQAALESPGEVDADLDDKEPDTELNADDEEWLRRHQGS